MTQLTVAEDGVTYLADHTVLLALPALLPAVIIAGVVIVIAVRDRRRSDGPADEAKS